MARISTEDQDQNGNKFKKMNQILRNDQEKKQRKRKKPETENRTPKNKNLHQIYKERKTTSKETRAESQREMRKRRGQREEIDQIERKGLIEKTNKTEIRLK